MSSKTINQSIDSTLKIYCSDSVLAKFRHIAKHLGTLTDTDAFVFLVDYAFQQPDLEERFNQWWKEHTK